MTADFAAYLRELQEIRKHPEATPELSLRMALVGLLRSVADAGLTVFPEVTTVEGQPDIIAKRGPLVVGYGETKPIGTMKQLEAVLDTPQLVAYRRLPNLLVSDYIHFILFRDGVEVGRASLITSAELDAGRFRRADRQAVEELIATWLSAEPAQITSSERLATELARRAAWLRDGIRAELTKEAAAAAGGAPDGPLRSLAKFYRENLMSDMDDDKFADAFAQTVAYGLFVGRFHLTTATFDRRTAIDAIPTSTSFLRSSTRFLLDETTVPPALSWMIDDLVALLRAAADALVQQAGTVKAAGNDAVIHFYEHFLAVYDADERIDRGIYYTFPPLVEYAVRAADDALEARFGIDGLADDRVRLLDPAVGTGTFLVGAAERAIKRVVEREGDALVPPLIATHLLPHLYGFELLPAPYAICHLKLGSFYEQHGRALAPNERANVFLTNSLAEPIAPTGGFLPAIGALVQEAQRADEVKREVPILVIIGNPPYRESSHNKEHLVEEMKVFRTVDGVPMKDRNTRPLDDDYLRFLRWSVAKLLEQETSPGRGIIAMVTNSSFLARKITRGVRTFVLNRFDEIRVLDLHGNQRDWFRGRVDQKVFPDVQVGIAITLFIRRGPQHEGPARVFYRETRGTVTEKFQYLAGASLGDGEWKEATPRAPRYSFVPRDVAQEWDSWPALDELMPWSSPGVITHRDRLSVGLDSNDLLPKVRAFADLSVDDREIRESYPKRSGLDDVKNRWELHRRRQAFGGVVDPKKVRPLLYRPFDAREIYDDVNIVGDRREPLRGHLAGMEGNIAIVSAESSSEGGSYALVSSVPGTQALLSSGTYGAAVYFPLYLVAVAKPAPDEHLLPLEEHERAATPNIDPAWRDRLSTVYDSEVEPADFAAYVYAIIASDTYRERYSEALADEFPRIPFTTDPRLFAALVEQGRALTMHHLLAGKIVAAERPKLVGSGNLRVEAPHYDAATERLYINPTQYLAPVSETVYQTKIGNYLPVDLWLRNREGRTLTRGEVTTLADIVAHLRSAAGVIHQINSIVGTVLESDTLIADV